MESQPPPPAQPPRYPSHLSAPPIQAQHSHHPPATYTFPPPPPHHPHPFSHSLSHLHVPVPPIHPHLPSHPTVLHPPPVPLHPDDPRPPDPHHLPSLTTAAHHIHPRNHFYDSPYAAAAKIARLEAELEKARLELERLKHKLAEYEKERKVDSPKVQSRYWTPTEHKRFLEALNKFGPKDVRAIANYVGSRNATQVRTHAQKYFLRLARESKGSSLQSARKRSMSENDLVRIGRAVGTPPGSPNMRERQNNTSQTNTAPLFHHQTHQGNGQSQINNDTQMTSVEGTAQPTSNGPINPNPQHSSLSRKVDIITGASGAKPPTLGGGITVSAGKPPVGLAKVDNTGINLLSMVASDRKMEEEKAADR